MRFSSTPARSALMGSFNHHWVADLFYDGSRRMADVPLLDPKFSEDSDGNIQQSGTVTIVWSDEFARSITPTEVTDVFAPFGAQLFVYAIIDAGPVSERIEYGRFEITNVPSALDSRMRFRGQWITTGSRLELELKELLAGVGEESFDVPAGPLSLASAWSEVARITGLQLTRTVPDRAITRSIMYPESKLDATYELMDVILESAPHMTADGTLSARPNAWPAPVDVLSQGDAGGLVSVGQSMSAAQVYNRVVVRAVSGEQTSVLAVAELRNGPLRVRNPDGSVSPFRARTRYLASEFVTTVAQAQSWADRTLEQVSVARARVVPVVELFNPLRERGDVLEVVHDTRSFVGRVVTIERSDHSTQSLTLEVARDGYVEASP